MALSLAFVPVHLAERIARGTKGLVRVEVPPTWKMATDMEREAEGRLPEFIEKVMIPMNRQEGDKLPVSTFNGCEDGTAGGDCLGETGCRH